VHYAQLMILEECVKCPAVHVHSYTYMVAFATVRGLAISLRPNPHISDHSLPPTSVSCNKTQMKCAFKLRLTRY